MTVHLSASLIKDYLECPKKVYYRINFPEFSLPTPDMIVGSIVHSALEYYWKDQTKLISYCDAKALELGIQNDHYTKLMGCITAFNNFRQYLFDDDIIENYFKVNISGIDIVGKMDRILHTGTIIDWKTTTKLPKTLKNDIQFIIYSIVYNILYDKPATSLLYISLTNNQILSYIPDKISEDVIINEIIPRISNDIKTKNLPCTGLYINNCYRCQYKGSCYKELGYKKEGI